MPSKEFYKNRSLKHYRKKEIETIKEAILCVLKYVEKNKGKSVLKKCLKSNTFPTFVEVCVFMVFRDKKPCVVSTGMADQPRVYYFRKAWDELKLPKFEKCMFHY